METSKILNADFLDILFEGRNKEYGAYELRKTYASRIRNAMAITISLVLILVAGFLFAGSGKADIARVFEIPDGPILEKIEDKPDPVVIPPPEAPKPPDVMERRSLDIVVVPDHLVSPEIEVPPNEELEHAKLSLVNRDGAAFDNIDMPPSGAGEAERKGIVAEPKSNNVDSLYLSVQINAEYPGGLAAWSRFLNKTLANNYPQEAIDQEISGKVVVKFIVDVEGNISNVEAISGPSVLHETAVKAIKKSGKWIPAQQNGRKVKAFRSQPIIFSIGE
ncbi:MAG: energy transducer TonB [Chitinophagaceae bacterium]|nr:MAG: energy transducer TonB [Chitinophagaceae bacterium]